MRELDALKAGAQCVASTHAASGMARRTEAPGGSETRPMRTLSCPSLAFAEQHRIVTKIDALMALCVRREAGLTTGETTRCRLLDALLHEALTPWSRKAANIRARP